MIDAERYLHVLLTDTFDLATLGYPYQIRPDVDVQNLTGDFPQLVWNVSGDGQVSNGPGLWTYTFTGNFYGIGMDQAKAFARSGYDVIAGWNRNPPATLRLIDGDVVSVASVTDIDAPTRLAQADIDGRLVVQYAGSWSLALRQT